MPEPVPSSSEAMALPRSAAACVGFGPCVNACGEAEVARRGSRFAIVHADHAAFIARFQRVRTLNARDAARCRIGHEDVVAIVRIAERGIVSCIVNRGNIVSPPAVSRAEGNPSDEAGKSRP